MLRSLPAPSPPSARRPGPSAEEPWGLSRQYANWPNLVLKQAWYKCFERLRHLDKVGYASTRSAGLNSELVIKGSQEACTHLDKVVSALIRSVGLKSELVI